MARVLRFQVGIVVAVVFSYLVAAPILTSSGKQTLQSAKSQTLSNIKQVALGMIMYSTDWDDLLPYAPDTKTAFAVMYPYVKNAGVFKSLNPSGSKILMNPALMGVLLSTPNQPAQTLFFYDSKDWPDGSRAAAFLDGHAKMLSPSQWKQAALSLKPKFPRNAKPLPKNYYKVVGPHGVDLGG